MVCDQRHQTWSHTGSTPELLTKPPHPTHTHFQLADTKWGVVAIEWRDVSCSHRVAKQARNPWGGRSPMPEWYKARPGELRMG